MEDPHKPISREVENIIAFYITPNQEYSTIVPKNPVKNTLLEKITPKEVTQRLPHLLNRTFLDYHKVQMIRQEKVLDLILFNPF